MAKSRYLVGYALKTKGYRVWLPSENRVEESIHVRFDESKNYKVDKQEKQNNKRVIENTRIDNWSDRYDDDEEEEIKEEIDRNEEVSGSSKGGERDERRDNVGKSDTRGRSLISHPFNGRNEITYRRDKTVGNNNRVYITYYPSASPTTRLRNIYDVKKYCNLNGYPFHEEEFNFETKTTLQDISDIIENKEI